MTPEEIFEQYQHLGKVTIFKMFPDPRGICRQHKIDMADLKQYAMEGMWKGCLSFNPNKGTQIKTHLINNIRWFVTERLKREVSLIKYDSNKYNSIEKFGLVSMDAQLNQNSGDEFNSYHDVISSDENIEESAIGNLNGEYILSQLNNKQKQIIELMSQGLSSGDIGRSWGMTAANVRHHAHKARKQLENYRGEVI